MVFQGDSRWDCKGECKGCGTWVLYWDSVTLGQRSQGQEHGTGRSAVSFVPGPEVVTSPPGTSVDPSVKGDAFFQRHYSSLALGSRGLRAAVWTRGQTFKGTPATLGDGPRICSSALPAGRRRGGGGARRSFHRHEHITNPTKVEFSNKINLLVWSVFCNFC